VPPPPEPPELVVRDATAWRRWLERHHTDHTGIWVVLAKKGTSEPTTLTYAAALEEALCFGWIDGQVRRRDDASYSQRFTPRRARSRWSQRNVEHVGRLLGAGRMHKAGIAEMERAQADGRWAAAYPGMAAAEAPADLAVALTGSPRASAAFAMLSAQNRYALLFRLGAIRGEAARAQRIAQFVAMLERGETIHPQARRPLSSA
jgi:uncharacterized protein YdeI (YjbR/CyaY-like superfamily)